MVEVDEEGNKYLTVGEVESLQKFIEALFGLKGLDVNVEYHNTYLKVPLVEYKED